MWGFGGRHYWERRERGNDDDDEAVKGGIVVLFAWSSSEDKYVRNYSRLYASLGWDSLICHSQFLNQCIAEKAASLASIIVIELVKELQVRPCAVVFASFSGGPKACMYKVLQIIEGKCKSDVNPDEYKLVRDCISGHIFDSCPIDFTSYNGARFLVHPSVLKITCPLLLASWVASCISFGLDALFLPQIEQQRTEYWQTLYSSISMGAPYLILCSEDDSISSCQTICNFARRLESLGGDVRLVKWSRSAHVAHYRHHPLEYRAAVTELLHKAAVTYSAKLKGD